MVNQATSCCTLVIPYWCRSCGIGACPEEGALRRPARGALSCWPLARSPEWRWVHALKRRRSIHRRSVLLSDMTPMCTLLRNNSFLREINRGTLSRRWGQRLTILNKSRLGDTVVRAGVDGNAYAYNSDLAYVSTNVLASSDLSDWAQELLPGLKLRISDAFRYTPQQPAFSIRCQFVSGCAQPIGRIPPRHPGSSSQCICKQLVHRRRVLLFALSGSAR